MIHTGDCIVSDAASRALKRAGVRAVSRGTNIVGQEDLFVALLQCPNNETAGLISGIPRLTALSASLTETEESLARIEAKRSGVDVWPSRPLQTCIELAVHDGRITADSLLLGLLAEPKTHLLKLIAAESAQLTGGQE